MQQQQQTETGCSSAGPDTRVELNKIIKEYADKTKSNYKIAWTILYSEVGERLGITIRRNAHERGIKTIEYIESEGLLEFTLEVARELFDLRTFRDIYNNN